MDKYSMKKLSDYLMDYLSKEGVHHIFMLPGGGCMHLVDSLGKHPNIDYTVNLHEQATAIAVEAYAQYTNDIGVGLVTTGPGGTNAITGVASAWLDSIPCLFISGQVKREDMKGSRGVRQMGFQEIDIVEMVKPITKYAVTVTDPNTILYHLQKALHLAKSGRFGPVWLDIPLDVQAAMINENELLVFDPKEIPVHISVDNQKIHDTIELINQSKRPVILVGNGVRLSNAVSLFLEFAQILNIPILTTWKTIDILPEDHRLYIGRPGSIGQRGANFALQNSDLFISIGARLDFGQIGYNHKNFARAAKKIIIDIDESEIGKMMTPIDVAISTDAKVFIQKMMDNQNLIQKRDHKVWLEKCINWKTKYPVVQKSYYDQENYVNDYVLIDLLSNELNSNDLLVPGSSGACSERTMQAFKVKQGIRIFNSEGLGAMGFGLPSAIGGCIASSRKRTICIDGDGGFVLNMQELEVVKRLSLPIKLFILNNSGYASIRITQKNYFQERYVGSNVSSGLTLPDFCKVASSFGIESIRIRNNKELIQNIKTILNGDGPILCELMIDPEQTTMPRVSSFQRGDGKMISKPLEDLYPFLEREEFLSNMIVPPIEE